MGVDVRSFRHFGPRFWWTHLLVVVYTKEKPYPTQGLLILQRHVVVVIAGEMAFLVISQNGSRHYLWPPYLTYDFLVDEDERMFWQMFRGKISKERNEPYYDR